MLVRKPFYIVIFLNDKKEGTEMLIRVEASI